MIFFADLFGLKEIYNVPGTVSEDDWSLRVPDDYETSYPARAERGTALHLPRVLAMARRARGDFGLLALDDGPHANAARPDACRTAGR